jgi:hypothetical protein
MYEDFLHAFPVKNTDVLATIDYFFLAERQHRFIYSTMFVKLSGVSVANFDPYPYVRSWIAAGNRQSTS